MTAQLQCPGMPMEDYYVTGHDGERYFCVLKSEKDYCKIAVEDGRKEVTGESLSKKMDMIFFPMPTGPDDPEHFPASFLAQFDEE